MMLDKLIHYQPPSWLSNSQTGSSVLPRSIPTYKISLGRFPTPIDTIEIPGLEDSGLSSFVKRDDLTSFDLSGNKVRKLEFLLADALQKKADCVITVGGIQSNHCRATAVATRQLGLQPHLILRKAAGQKNDDGEELGLTGNLLFNRLVGSEIHTVSASTYAQLGSDNLAEMLSEQLKEQGKHPYVIPVGGSNALGVFGYIDCVREIMEQCAPSSTSVPSNPTHYDHILIATGSGGTVAGMAIALKLSGLSSSTKLHAIAVCDSPDYFYNHIEEVAVELGLDLNKLGPVRSWCNIYPGFGIGYAKSTEEELKYLIEFSEKTGILLDPVYSGKAVYYFVKDIVKNNPDIFLKGQKLLFIHTGGVLGFYDKESQLLPLLAPKGQVNKLKITK
jgi:D-cysteine desulfhydrase